MRLFDTTRPDHDEAMDQLEKMHGYPFDPEKDAVFVGKLLEEFPQIDLAEEIRQWEAWMMDHETEKEVRHRARLRTWCKKAVEFAERRRMAGGDTSSGGGARPGTAAEHGETSDRLEQL